MGGATCPLGAGSSPLWRCGWWLVDGAGRGDHRRAAGGRRAFSAGTGAAADMVVANGSCGKSSRRESLEPNTAGEDPSCRRRQALEAPGCGVCWVLGQPGSTQHYRARAPGNRGGTLVPAPPSGVRCSPARLWPGVQPRPAGRAANALVAVTYPSPMRRPHSSWPQPPATDRPVHKHGSAR